MTEERLNELERAATEGLPTEDGGADWSGRDILELVAEVRGLRFLVERLASTDEFAKDRPEGTLERDALGALHGTAAKPNFDARAEQVLNDLARWNRAGCKDLIVRALTDAWNRNA